MAKYKVIAKVIQRDGSWESSFLQHIRNQSVIEYQLENKNSHKTKKVAVNLYDIYFSSWESGIIQPLCSNKTIYLFWYTSFSTSVTP